MAFLIVESGPAAGTKYELDEPAVTVGRNLDFAIVVPLDRISRQHAEILRADGDYFVRDLQSRNGTYVNEQKLSFDEQRPLQTLDRLRICDVVFTFHEGAAQPDLDPDTPVEIVESEEPSNSSLLSRMDVSSIKLSVSPEAKLQALLEITRSLGKALAPDEVLPQVLNGLFKIFPQADRGFIVLKADGDALIPRWTSTRGDRERTIRISETIINEVIDKKEAILSADAATEFSDTSQSVSDVRIRSMMCAPLINSDDQAFGVLQVDSLGRTKMFMPEDLEVLVSVAGPAGIAITNAQLHEATLQQKTLHRDLQLAHEVQHSFLPNRRPEIPGYEFYDFYEPAYHVGGDYYDYISLPDGRTAVVVADVAGKGVAAALMMAKLAAETRFCLASCSSPAEAVTQLNASIAQLLVHRFATLVMAVIDPQRHELTIVNAGHWRPIIRRSDGTIEEPGEQQGGPPVGVKDKLTYRQVSVPLGPGELVTMYTDGLNESKNTSGKLYGADRIRQHVREAAEIEQLGRGLIADIDRFAGAEPQSDDMCLVIFRRTL